MGWRDKALEYPLIVHHDGAGIIEDVGGDVSRSWIGERVWVYNAQYGHYAIQFAKWGGSTVITTVISEEKAEHARRAGADHILNYRQEDVVAQSQKPRDRQRVSTGLWKWISGPTWRLMLRPLHRMA